MFLTLTSKSCEDLETITDSSQGVSFPFLVQILHALFTTLKSHYNIHPKYWDTLTIYHTCTII